MKPIIKTSVQLLEEGLISEYEVRKFPSHWKNTTVLIFPNKVEATKFVKEVLIHKVGEKLTEVWSSLTGPPVDDDPILDSIRGRGGPDPHREVWLLFKNEDFNEFIQPALT